MKYLSVCLPESDTVKSLLSHLLILQVVLCHDLHVWSFLCHLLSYLCLCC